jgi:hypothetical protein
VHPTTPTGRRRNGTLPASGALSEQLAAVEVDWHIGPLHWLLTFQWKRPGTSPAPAGASETTASYGRGCATLAGIVRAEPIVPLGRTSESPACSVLPPTQSRVCTLDPTRARAKQRKRDAGSPKVGRGSSWSIPHRPSVLTLRTNLRPTWLRSAARMSNGPEVSAGSLSLARRLGAAPREILVPTVIPSATQSAAEAVPAQILRRASLFRSGRFAAAPIMRPTLLGRMVRSLGLILAIGFRGNSRCS